MEPSRLLRGFGVGRRWIVLGALLGGVAGSVTAKLAVHPTYEARSVLRWEPPASNNGAVPADPQREFRTLVGSVKLPSVFGEARQRLGLGTTLEALARRVTVDPAESSNLFVVSASAEGAEEAAGLANAVVEAFVAERTELERAKLHAAVDARSQDLGEARRTLRAAREGLDAFRAQHALADLPLETNATLDLISRLDVESKVSRADAGGERARVEALRGAAAVQPKTTVLAEREALLAAEARARKSNELSAAGAHLATDHPKIESLKAEVDALAARERAPGASVVVERSVGINPARASIEAGLTTSDAQRKAANTKADLFAGMLATARERLERLTALEGAWAGKIGEVHAAEGHVATVETAYAAAVDAGRAPQTGLLVLERASAPDRPAKSTRKAVALAGLGIGLALGLLSRLVRALDGLRLHGPREIAWWTQVPVAASATETELDGIARALVWQRDRLPEPLVIAWSPIEAPAAGALVARWNEISRRDRRRSQRETARARAYPCARTTNGDPEGTDLGALRQAAREAVSVVVVVQARAHGAFELSGLRERLGRTEGVAIAVTGIGPEFATGADRVGVLPVIEAIGKDRRRARAS